MAYTKYRPTPDLTTEELLRFWQSIDERGEDECWPWLKSTNQDGYGRVKFRYKPFTATRVAYFLYHGIELKGLACHTCDNPACCNPMHLFDGTSQDNARDRDRKGRRTPVRGTASNLSKINDEIAYDIQLEIVAKTPDVVIAEKHGVSAATIANIRKGYQWNHVRAPGFVPYRRPGNHQKTCWPKASKALRPAW